MLVCINSTTPSHPHGQVLADIGTNKARQLSSTIAAFLAALKAVQYLDVGLGCRGAFLTDPGALDGLARQVAAPAAPRSFRIVFHVTPRTREPRHMPWIAAERARMLALLQERGVACELRAHFGDRREDSLDLHFQVHSAWRQATDCCD